MAYTKLAFQDKVLKTPKISHKSNSVLWLHPSLDDLAPIAIDHQISSRFIHIHKAEATRNYILEHVSSFIV